MTKKQKIWLGVFLAMFLVPEILWSPVGNIIFELFQSGNAVSLRNNFLTNYQHIFIYRFVLILQLSGLLFTSITFLKFNTFKNKFLKYFLYSIFLIFTFLCLIVVYLSFALNNISF